MFKLSQMNYRGGPCKRGGSKFGGTLDPLFGVGPLFMDAIVEASIVTTIGSKSNFNFASILVCNYGGVNFDHYREQKLILFNYKFLSTSIEASM